MEAQTPDSSPSFRPSRKAKFSFNGGFSSAQQQQQQAFPTDLATSVRDGPSATAHRDSAHAHADSTNEPNDFSVPDDESRSIDSADVGDGSSVRAAVFNFTNAIIGAGAIGLGGAFALSGGCIAIVSILACAYLTKLSLDLVLELSLLQGVTTYEDLGFCGLGRVGKLCVTWSKLLYSFGCLIAYVIVVKDNLGPAFLSLVSGGGAALSPPIDQLLHNADLLTFLTSLLVILPLCMLRDMTPLANFSMMSVLAMIMIVGIVASLYFFPPVTEHHQDKETSVFEDWFEIRWNGYLQSLGTYVFTFVSVRHRTSVVCIETAYCSFLTLNTLLISWTKFLQQHMVHMAYASLKPELRTFDNWKRVSSLSLSMASAVSLSVGLFAYMTFWQAQGSDIFEMYPNLAVISLARLLLCGTMLLTFPLPFFTCRELLILLSTEPCTGDDVAQIGAASPADALDDENCDLEVPLLPSSNVVDTDGTAESLSPPLPRWLIAKNQLRIAYHVTVTVALWLATTCLAIVAPNLGDILAIVGCATGSAIAFVLPSMLALKLQGYSHKALVLLLVGVTVLFVGSFYSGRKLIQDVYRLA
jgi:amino acid permease